MFAQAASIERKNRSHRGASVAGNLRLESRRAQVKTLIGLREGILPGVARSHSGGHLETVAQANGAFRILVLGDFSGRGRRQNPSLESRRLFEILPDNFDAVMARLKPAATVPVGSQAVTIAFDSVEDFHPDSLWRRLPVFAPLRELRQVLNDPAAFAETVRRLGLITPAPESPAAPPPPSEGGSLLEQIAAASAQARQEPGAAPEDLWRRVLDAIVAPHLVPKPDPRQRQLVAQLDALAGHLMRAILHHADFQALETAWRSLFWLLCRLEVGEDIELYVLDAARDEVFADLRRSPELWASRLYGLFVDEGQWVVVVGLYEFAPEAADLAVLERLGSLAGLAGGAFVAAAAPSFRGALSAEEQRLWSRLRGSAAAGSIGLAWPRFLLRLPYGRQTAAVEEFDFEEMPAEPEPGAYLWGNPAIPVACLLGRNWVRRGWAPGAPLETEIGALPVHTWRDAGGELHAQPCAECRLTEAEALRLLELGLIPLLSLRDRDAIRVLRLQSVAATGALLPVAGNGSSETGPGAAVTWRG